MKKQVSRNIVGAVLVALASFALALGVQARQGAVQKAAPPRTQQIDQEYTKRILDATPDKRILTEFVDHMPASPTVPSPLKFFGYVPGENSRLTYYKDIVSYYEALAKASPRAKFWKIGKTEEGCVFTQADDAVCSLAISLACQLTRMKRGSLARASVGTIGNSPATAAGSACRYCMIACHSLISTGAPSADTSTMSTTPIDVPAWGSKSGVT